LKQEGLESAAHRDDRHGTARYVADFFASK